MIYDCIVFFNEVELLKIRLNELNNIVDKVVLVESTVTFTNKPKPLYYLQNKQVFKKFQQKIIHIIVDDSPDVSNPWLIEEHQMSAVVRGLKNCKPSDTILLSDADEMPRGEKVLEWKEKSGKHKVFLQDLCYYYFNLRCVNEKWRGTRMFKYKDLLTYKNAYIAQYTKPDVEISDGGWHFSYIGGYKKIQQKLASFSHQEYNNDKYNTKENITKAMLQKNDFLKHGLKFKIIDINFLPKYVLENRNKFKNLLTNKTLKENKLQIIISEYLEFKKWLRFFYRYIRRIYVSSINKFR